MLELVSLAICAAIVGHSMAAAHWSSRYELHLEETEGKISVVLPTVLEDWSRTALLLASFDRFIDKDMIFAWYWILPASDMMVPHHLPPADVGFKHVLVGEEELLQDGFAGSINKSEYFAGGKYLD